MVFRPLRAFAFLVTIVLYSTTAQAVTPALLSKLAADQSWLNLMHYESGGGETGWRSASTAQISFCHLTA